MALQIALKKRYFILTVVKPIKYNKERNTGFFRVILRVSK